VASKKTWKRRAKRAQEDLGYYAGQLGEIDNMLHEAKFEGETKEEWLGTFRTFVVKLYEKRGLMLPFPVLSSAKSISLAESQKEEEGIYTLPTMQDLNQSNRLLDPDATRG
jgi:hypothetical protein